MKQKIKFICIGLAILALACAFRFTGIRWDNNHHLHPDERFVSMVAMDITWPATITEYFTTATSPLNPHNAGHNFYVYGTWPVYAVKGIAQLAEQNTFDGITQVGRVCSGIADICTLIIVFFIGLSLTKHHIGGLFGAFIYACLALPIQLSHYFTVDPYLTVFLAALFLLLLKKPTVKTCVCIGLCFGIAIATKVSALIMMPVIGVWFLYYFIKSKKYIQILLYGLLCLAICFITIRIWYPYLFQEPTFFSPLNTKLIDNWTSLKDFDNPNVWYPPSIQWITTTPYLFPLWNIIWVGVGIPITLLFLISLRGIWKHRSVTLGILVVCILAIFGYQGIQFAKATRYFYPLYPAFAAIIGLGIYAMWKQKKQYIPILVCACIIWPIMTTSIYNRPSTRIAASEWIYAHIPSGSPIGIEHWDDGLPLPMGDHWSNEYKTIELPLFEQDSPEKWNKINEKLRTVQYIILSSNRAYGSTTSVPARYPETTLYYKKLFDGSLGFVKIAEFTSRPSIPFPTAFCIQLPFFTYGAINKPMCQNAGIQIVDDYVDEIWTVYDHPKVTIFARKDALKKN